MIFNEKVKRKLAILRSERKALKEMDLLQSQGFRRHQPDWEIDRGGLQDHIIVDAKISCCGKYIYTKLGKKSDL